MQYFVPRAKQARLSLRVHIRRLVGAISAALAMGSSTVVFAQCPFNPSGVVPVSGAVDGVILARAAALLADASLVSQTGSTRPFDTVHNAIASNEIKLDVNASGVFDETDAAIVARYLMGFRGESLIPNGPGFGALRKTASEIQNFIDGGCSAPAPARKKLSVMKAEQMALNNGGVFISVLDDVEIDQDIDLAWLEVQGTLTCSDNTLNVSSRWIVVHGGSLRCGTPFNPFTRNLTITLTGNDVNTSALGMMGAKVLGAMHGGRLEIYGERRTSWTKLGTTASVGATQITLKESPDWRVGERIVIASSSFEPNEAEERVITAVNGNTVTLNQALAYRHYGELQTFDGKTLDSRAEVGLLSRNIVIEGDADSVASNFGGHVMIMGASSSTRETDPSKRSSAKIRGVEFRRLGQFNRLGRYPFHWHLNGTSNGDFLEQSAIHSSLQRGVVVHGTDGVAVRNNVVLKTPGHAFAVEDGTELASVFERNLGLLPRPVNLTAVGLSEQDDQAAAVFWMRTAAATLIGNSAAGGSFAGYWFDTATTVSGDASKALLTFQGNTVHSHRSTSASNVGSPWAVWHTDGFVPSDNGVLLFDSLTAYKNEKVIETGGRSVTSNSMFADNGMVITGGTIRDSVVVSRSANIDTDPEWGQTGLFAYGDFAHAENVTWVNFREGRLLARTLVCWIESPRFTNRDAKLIDSVPAAGCGDAILTDFDGSLSGVQGMRQIVSVDGDPYSSYPGANYFGQATSECQVRLMGYFESYAICPYYDYRVLNVTYPEGPVEWFYNDMWKIDVVRTQDGNRYTPNHFRWAAYVIPGKSYRLETRKRQNVNDVTDYGLQNLAYVDLGLSKGDFADAATKPGGPNIWFDPAAATRTLIVNAPTPTLAYRVRRCQNGTSCNENPGSWPVISATQTLAQLQAASGAGYAVEGGRIHFKLFGGDRLRFERQ
jgi:hypothetical protein